MSSDRPDDERFRRLFQAMPDGLVIFTPLRASSGEITDFRYAHVNPVTASQLGRPPGDLPGRTLLELTPEVRGTPFFDALCRVAQSQQRETFEQPSVMRGSTRSFRAWVLPLGDEIAVTFSDVTDHKRAEDSLRFLAEASSILSSSLDYDTTLAAVTRLAVPVIADWATVDMVGGDGHLRRVAVAHVDPRKVDLAHELERRYPTDLNASHGIANVLRTGNAEMISEITDELLASSIQDPQLLGIIRSLGLRSTLCVPVKARGRVVGAMTLFCAESGRRYSADDLRLAEDLARRVSTAIENAVLYRTAEEANQAKDDFLATVSHELRTPLNAILGWVQILRSDEMPSDRRARALETIERNARAQNNLIEDLLDVSRIVSGKLRIDVQNVDLPLVVERAIETTRPAATAKDVVILQTVNPDAGPILGDPDRLQQVVWNLVSNAVKFSPKGGRIHVTVRKKDSSVEIVVKDQGQGIDPGFLPHVFERFRQADGRTTRAKGGLGLGLAIVRNLVEIQGGTVRAESDGVGLGATFTVTLPLSPPRSHVVDRPPALRLGAPPVETPHALVGLKVLVVDDEADARDLLRELLTRSKMRVLTAGNVEEAMGLVAAERPNLLVSDIGMPEEDGYALIRRLRALPAAEGGQTPAVALTAYARTEDRTKALVAGFSTHVAKPVEAPELIAVLGSLASVFFPRPSG